MNLVDEDMFRRRDDFDQILEANRPLVQARDFAISGARSPQSWQTS